VLVLLRSPNSVYRPVADWTARTVRAAMESCAAKTSSTAKSKRSDQSEVVDPAGPSRNVARARAPCRWTVRPTTSPELSAVDVGGPLVTLDPAADRAGLWPATMP
jgi:hypothetical protein